MRQLLIAVDQLANAVLGGSADETLSARAWRAEQSGRVFGRIFRPVIDGLFFWDADHCRDSFQSELERRHLPPAYRE